MAGGIMSIDPEDIGAPLSPESGYLLNYTPNKLYVNPGRNGAYASLLADDEVLLSEIDVTERSKLAVSAFYVKDKTDYGTFKITKLKYHKTHGWQEDGTISVSPFTLAKMGEFMAIIASLDLREAKKTRLALENLHIEALGPILASNKGAAVLRELASSPELHDDIYAVAAKRTALEEFEKGLSADLSEPEWQSFFERNPWIFGHGLNYVFLDKVADKLEAVTTGSSFDRAGKRADGLLYTRAEVSQYVLVEIKRNDTDLLRKDRYRPGCWTVADELSNAVTQIQKTTFEFGRNRLKDNLKDHDGNDTGAIVYAVEPRSFLVIGNLGKLAGNDDKVTCFELYRRNIIAPEILTFDELFCRTRYIVENLSRNANISHEKATTR
jgi:hypothetical protein